MRYVLHGTMKGLSWGAGIRCRIIGIVAVLAVLAMEAPPKTLGAKGLTVTSAKQEPLKGLEKRRSEPNRLDGRGVKALADRLKKEIPPLKKQADSLRPQVVLAKERVYDINRQIAAQEKAIRLLSGRLHQAMSEKVPELGPARKRCRAAWKGYGQACEGVLERLGKDPAYVEAVEMERELKALLAKAWNSDRGGAEDLWRILENHRAGIARMEAGRMEGDSETRQAAEVVATAKAEVESLERRLDEAMKSDSNLKGRYRDVETSRTAVKGLKETRSGLWKAYTDLLGRYQKTAGELKRKERALKTASIRLAGIQAAMKRDTRSKTRRILLKLNNKERLENNRRVLTRSAGMEAVAQKTAEMCAREGVLSHGIGGGFARRAGGCGGGAENMARASSAADAMRLWMASSGHRGNALNDGFGSVGFGVADGKGGRYFVAIYGR